MSQPTDSETALLRELEEQARDVMSRAYAPYSKFFVGAALRAADGRIFTGCNVENASYGHTICAERTATAKAVSEGARAFTHILVLCSADIPVTPCGACRQVLNEFSPGVEVITVAANALVRRWKLHELLPEAFGPGQLG